MRRSDRQVTDPREIEEMLRAEKVLRVAMNDAHGLYIVPVNYGYEFRGDTLVFLFHGAYTGRKAEAMAQPVSAAFELDGGMTLIPHEEACRYGCGYYSVIGTGTASTVTDIEEKKRALTLIMAHQTGKRFDFTDEMAATTAVFMVEASEYTAKKR